VTTLRERTVSGLLWSAASQTGRQAVLLASSVVLARLLTPHDFGLVATVLVFVNFAVVVAEQGFGAALIQREKIEERHLSTIWWLSLGVGAAMTGVFLAAAPLVGRAYGEPALVPLTRLIAFVFALNSLGMVQTTLLTRELAFKTLAKAEVAGAWVGALAGVACALAGLGAWSIAVQSLATSLVSAAALWALCPWRPRALFDARAVRELASFSSSHFLGNAANYWVRNVDNLLVGLLLGQRELGVYGRAYSVMLFPLSRVTRVLSRVMFPALSIQQSDPASARRLFLRLTATTALVTFPMMLGVSAAAPFFVACVFGPQWGEMVPVLRVLAVVGTAQSVSILLTNIYASQGTPELRLRVALPLQALQVAGIVVGLRWGIVGVAWGYALASLASIPVDAFYGGRLIGLSLGGFAGALSGIFACAAGMAGAVFLLAARLPLDRPFSSFALLAVAGVVVYALLLRLFAVEAYGFARAELARRLPARFGGAA
jgi:PST family polysaccharide transporter